MDPLLPVELAYRGVNRARRALYRRGVFRAEALPRPVIAIGNRALGGSGKTPATIALARALMGEGKRVAVLSRGYGRASTEEPLLVDGRDADRYGDEPVVLHEELGVPVVVGARRAAAARWFLERGDCDLFLMDDGFQHLQLHRDANVVIENGSATRFREGEGALADADVVLLRNGAGAPPHIPSFRVELVPVGWASPGGELPLDSLRGKSAVAFAGLADNAQFFAMISSLGIDLRGTLSFRDHQRYGAREVSRIEAARRSEGAELLITTAKDRARLNSLEVTALRVEMRIERRDELLALLLSRLGG